MEIGLYIADLLRKQDKVGVPGLGTFSRNKVPGSYDSVNNSFLPPFYEVSFSKEIIDSQDLPEYISLKKNLSSTSAEYFLKKFTSGILDLLKSSGNANVNPLGNIRENNETLTFETSPDFKLDAKFYGLKPVSDIKPNLQTVAMPIAAPVLHDGFREDDTTRKESEDEIEDEEIFAEEKGRSNTLMIILGALLFAIIVAALFYIFNPTTKNLVDQMFPGLNSNTSITDSGKKSRTSPVIIPDSMANVSPPVVQDSSVNDSVPAAEPTVIEPKTFAALRKIEIIGATFGKRSEAEAYIRVMQKKGFQAKIADDMPGKLFKVSLASFEDEQSAQKELNRIVREVEKTAWIAKYKSKKTQ